MKQGNRIPWIDVAKGICMIAVIAGHMGVKAINLVVFSFHLTVFFILSGYTLKNNFSLDSLTKRFRSLMVPYFVTCFAVTVMDAINLILLSGETSFLAITKKIGYDITRSLMASGTFKNFGSIDFGGHIGAIWYLPATFFAVSIAQALLKYVPRRGHRYAISAACAICACLTSTYLWLPFSIQSGMLAVPLVLLGYDLKQEDLLKHLTLPRALICLAVFIAGVIWKKTLIYYVTAYMTDYLISTICALASSLFVIYISQKLEKSKALAWIGRNSIFFLCVHLFEMETMGTWFRRFLALIKLPVNTATLFLVRFLFISAIAFVLVLFKNRRRKEIQPITGPRDLALDVAKAGLIILMIVGHFAIDERFRKIIYSFHMAAFVFFSGYYFHPETSHNLFKAIWKQIKQFLLPYALFGIAYILLTNNGLLTELKTLALGLSFSKNIFADIPSIGPVYFILLLFLTKVIYLFIDRFCPKEHWKAAVVLVLSLFGQFLGHKGWWLPWSADCSLYALAFYYIGHCFKKYGIMEYLCRRNFSYFVLSCIWAYMVHKGSMEIAVRNYGAYCLTLMGAVSACVLVYMCCQYICATWNRRIIYLLCQIGKHTLSILVVHRLLSRHIGNIISLCFSKDSVYYAVLTILAQVFLGVLIGSLIAYIRPKNTKAIAPT